MWTLAKIMISSEIFYIAGSRVVGLSFPLFLVYFISHGYGVESYGGFVYFQAVFTFATLLITLNSDSYSAKILKEKTTPFRFWLTFLPRSLLFLCLVTVWLVTCLFTSSDVGDFTFNFFFIYVPLQLALTPNYYFQATGYFKPLFFCTIIDKATSLIILYFFEPKIVFIPLIIFCISFVTIILLHAYLFSVGALWLKVTPRRSFQMLEHYTKVNTKLAIGKLTQVNTSLAKVILESFAGLYYVAAFDIFEKIINFCKIPFSLIYQYAFSRLRINLETMARYLVGCLILAGVSVIAVNYFEGEIFHFLGFDHSLEITTNFLLFSMVILVVPFTQTFTYFVVLRQYDIKVFSYLQLSANGVALLLLGLIVFNYYSFRNFIWWILLCELALPLLSVLYLLGLRYAQRH